MKFCIRQSELCIKQDEVLADIRSAAWLEQELHPDLDRHRRHQMADICEAGNAERVWRVFGVAVAEIRLALASILRPEKEQAADNGLQPADDWRFCFRFSVPPATLGYIREKIHEYLVDRAMADRAEVIIPQCAAIWSDRAAEALASLRIVASTTRPPHAPVRRPLWPI